MRPVGVWLQQSVTAMEATGNYAGMFAAVVLAAAGAARLVPRSGTVKLAHATVRFGKYHDINVHSYKISYLPT